MGPPSNFVRPRAALPLADLGTGLAQEDQVVHILGLGLCPPDSYTLFCHEDRSLF